VVEGQGREGRLGRGIEAQERGEQHGPVHAPQVRRRFQVGDNHYARLAVQAVGQGGHPPQGVEAPALEQVAVGREQDLGLDLPEAVQHAIQPEVR